MRNIISTIPKTMKFPSAFSELSYAGMGGNRGMSLNYSGGNMRGAKV